MRRFPLRTQLLMILALAAFVRLWCMTHPRPSPALKRAVEVTVQPVPDEAGPADSGAAD